MINYHIFKVIQTMREDIASVAICHATPHIVLNFGFNNIYEITKRIRILILENYGHSKVEATYQTVR
jgi:hypothetical protein